MKIINRLLVDDDGWAMYCGFSCMQCGMNCVHLEVKGNEIVTHCTKRSFLISAGKPEAPAADSNQELRTGGIVDVMPRTGGDIKVPPRPWGSVQGKDSEGQPCRVFGPAGDTETHD